MLDTTCSVEGCARRPMGEPGYCRMHLARYKRNGEPGEATPRIARGAPKRPCAVDGCEFEAEAREWCPIHYGRWRRYRDPTILKRCQSYGNKRCKAAECELRAQALGYCQTHYLRVKRSGTTDEPGFGCREDAFFFYVARTPTGCWEWVSTTSSQGYAEMWGGVDAEKLLAHRWSYEHFKEPIPLGFVVDHTCHNADLDCVGGKKCSHRRCVNPEHLDAVTIQENVRRGALRRVAKKKAGR